MGSRLITRKCVDTLIAAYPNNPAFYVCKIDALINLNRKNDALSCLKELVYVDIDVADSTQTQGLGIVGKRMAAVGRKH